ncbi:hypothetical protein WJX73_010781 [Symbiochloris irregularis]|uniref:PsbP C-terminal domain-containing protein n=1 Tax=Symbiochloris irregularis TaxID=706552 RepID=A0AAW1P5T3_9CHLO
MLQLHQQALCPLAASAVQVQHPARRCRRIACHAGPSVDLQAQSTGCSVARREAVLLAAAASLVSFTPGPALAKGKQSELTMVKDANDGYEFGYPLGWQEVSVKGQDVVYKDIIEPLESVSVSIAKTDKASIDEFGPLGEVALTLASKVLSPPKQEVKILNVKKREDNGRLYYEFEFASKANTYIRHALAAVTIGNGKFYTLATGANEKRWDKMKERLEDVVASFQVSDRYTG